MPDLHVNVDVLFKLVTDRAIIVVDDAGEVVKCNIQASGMLPTRTKPVAGKSFNSSFGKLSISPPWSFDSLVRSPTEFQSFIIKQKKAPSVNLQVKVKRIIEEGGKEYFFITCKIAEKDSPDKRLFEVMKGTERHSGTDFLESSIEAIAKMLGIDYAFIGKLIGGKQASVRTLSFWEKTRIGNNFTYQLAGTPCENVIDKCQILINKGVQEKYPKDEVLKQIGIESYFGTPIYYHNGKPLGILVVMDSKPIAEQAYASYSLQIFANRIGSEIEWLESVDRGNKTEKTFSQVMNAIPNPVYYRDKQGRYSSVNHAFLELTGLSEDELKDKAANQLEALAFIKNKIKGNSSVSASQNQQHYETERVTDNGKKQCLLINETDLLDEAGNQKGVVGSLIDITPIKDVQMKIKSSEERYRMLFSRANDGIIILGKDIFIDCNERALEMFGGTREQILGRSPAEFSPELQPDGRISKEAALEKITNALRGNPQLFYWQHKSLQGELFDCEISLTTFHIDNELYIQAIMRDVSAQLKQQKEKQLHQDRMTALYQIITNTELPGKQQINSVLKFATKALNMEHGILSQISGEAYKIVDFYSENGDFRKGQVFNFKETYCDITYQQDHLVAIPEMSNSPYTKHPCFKEFKLQAYIGMPYWIRRSRYGTLSFSSEKPIEEFRSIDYDFVQLIAQWVGAALERQIFEDNLLAKDALMEAMLREIPIDFSIRDDKLIMLFQSDLCKKNWGDLEGKSIDFQDVDKQSASKWKTIFNKALKGKMHKGEDHVEIHGKAYDFYSIVSPVQVQGKVSQIMVINVDLSKIKATEQKLKEQNNQLTKLNEELDRFVYSASHDLRAPLASLLGLIDLAGRESISESTRHFLQLMDRSINKLDTFISEITDYSRNLRLSLDAHKIDFQQVISESFDQVKYMSPSNAQLHTNISANSDFKTDTERLKMIFNNIISNSIRYKQPKHEPEITFDIDVQNRKALINISDNGIGIPKKHHDKVFNMFYRATDKNVGSGLGLFIVKETVEKLHGSVGISSTINKGTTVHIVLPSLN